MKFSIENASKIKLIIWDLDETFWKGTLSDNDVPLIPVQLNIDIVKKLTDRGIINCVCSKNDKQAAEEKLEKMGVIDYFVFNSINWEPKGTRIKNILLSMALRPANVLFLDDNYSNLAEAEFILPDLMVASPDIISSLWPIVDTLGKNDFKHTRLQQYKVLEKKRKDAQVFNSNIDFLRQSNIKIQYSDLDEESIPRIAELIQRSNQLNFTKKRIGEKDLKLLINDPDYKLGYVSVSDNYGKYGIVGFYALEKSKHRLEHFLFSCRTMGMGIEQHVYATLDCPELIIVEPVSGKVTKEEGLPDYILRVNDLNMQVKEKNNGTGNQLKVLLKGPCDLEVMASYIESREVVLDKEFNFVDSNGNQADYYNHLVNILNCGSNFVMDWCRKYSFLSPEAFETNLFSGKYDVICLSPLMDATLAVYEDGRKNSLAYGLYSKPICLRENHRQYLGKKIMTARSNYDEAELTAFSEEFQIIKYTPEMVANNLKRVVDRILEKNNTTKIVILLLGELEYKSNNSDYYETFGDKHIIHTDINLQIKKVMKDYHSVYLLDVNKFITSQADYFDNINHYSKQVYYKMAQEFVSYINQISVTDISTSSKLKMLLQNIKRNIYKKFFIR